MNINNFPLYNILTTDLDERKDEYNKILKKAKSKKLAKTLADTTGVNRDSIYLIIKIFNLKNEKVPYLFDVPYDGKVEQNNIEKDTVNLSFDLKNLPDRLACLLQIFSEKYL